MSLNRRLKYEPITIKEPHKDDVKIFNDTDDFTQYYRSHEDEFKTQSKSSTDKCTHISTLILNRTYKVPGYRISITKRGTDQEELQLKKDYYSTTNNLNTNDSSTDNSDNIMQEIKFLSQRIDNIERFLSEIK